MKAYIKSDGTLVIVAENETENYAVIQWVKESTRNAIAWTVVSGLDGTKMTGQFDMQSRVTTEDKEVGV